MLSSTVTFDRVFDVVRKRFRAGLYTLFSFECGGQKILGARVLGHPHISAGMTVTPVFEVPGDWTTLRGWVCHDTGSIHMPAVTTRQLILPASVTANVLLGACTLVSLAWSVESADYTSFAVFVLAQVLMNYMFVWVTKVGRAADSFYMDAALSILAEIKAGKSGKDSSDSSGSTVEAPPEAA